MKRYTLLAVILMCTSSFTFAQSSVFGSITEAKSKIEATVPVVIEYLKKTSEKEGDQTILTNGTEALRKEYNAVSQEFDLYKGNLASCIVNKKKKVATKCLNYHTQYFRSTLTKYDNFISYLTKKNGFLGVDDEEVKKDLKPTEIATTIDKDFTSAAGATANMKGVEKTKYFESLKSDDLKLQPFNSLVN
ncbi:hypothetical protein [Chryseobacterium foetidum]|uniref:hypothetical protein n=1 Tax=Chryseobacterium foetidum TaxID=2951057 RepID=UPI0021CADDAD|nr:hypothetical protein [Chryseobacterium foetidum]